MLTDQHPDRRSAVFGKTETDETETHSSGFEERCNTCSGHLEKQMKKFWMKLHNIKN